MIVILSERVDLDQNHLIIIVREKDHMTFQLNLDLILKNMR